MNSRQRVRRILNHQEADRVPIDVGGGTSTSIIYDGYKALAKYLNIQYEEPVEFQSFLMQIVKMDEKVMQKLESDVRPLLGRQPDKTTGGFQPDGTFIDEWGVVWKKPEAGYYYEMVAHPLAEATIGTLDNYSWPDPGDSGRTRGIEEGAKFLYENTDYAIMANPGPIDIWQRAYYMRGMEKMFMDLLLNKDFVHRLFRKITDYNKEVFKDFLEKAGRYIDVVRTADDLASTQSLLMSPQTYREMLKPYHQELFSYIKQFTDAKIFFHSCGNVYPIIDDLIDAGIDILNPVQVSAAEMDTAVLKEGFGDRLVFWGGIDTTRVLPAGSKAEVITEVKKRINDLAKGGGFVLSSVHNIQPDVPAENIYTMCEAAIRYGQYPING